MSIEAGQILGNYRVIRQIGTGGMGMVFLAEHPLIGKRVALKVIHRDIAAKPEVVARFTNEARAVSRIAGDHVVSIHDFGQSPDGDCFFVMDYLEGHTIAAELLAGNIFTATRALYIGAQLADALAAVHANRMVHRDLKPDNVMLVDRDGASDFVVLLDFGLVKFLDDAAGPGLTARGMLLGTPQYMSPEACSGKQTTDHRSDQYSLGVVLFQMMTGHVPFEGRTTSELLIEQMRSLPPPLRGIVSSVPPAVEQIVLRLLAKDKEDRFPDMGAVRTALLDPDWYMRGSPPVAASSGRAKETRAMFVKKPQEPRPAAGPRPLQDAEEAREAEHGRWGGRQSQPRPIAPANQTLPMATPPGFKKAPARGLWPMAVFLLALAAAAAIVWALGGSEDQLRATAQLDAAAEAATHSGQDGSVAPLPPVVRLSVITEPSRAEVFDDGGRLLGLTPLELDVPRGSGERTLRIVHPEAVQRLKTYDASRDTTLELELEPIAKIDAGPSAARPGQEAGKARPRRRSKRSGRGEAEGKDQVLRPSF